MQAVGSATILIVDDERTMVDVARRALARQGYRVITAQSVDEAVVLARKHGPTIDLLLSDVVMPEASGFELAAMVAPLLPNLKVLYMTGHPGDRNVPAEVQEAGRILRKPFTPRELVAAVQFALAHDSGRPAKG